MNFKKFALIVGAVGLVLIAGSLLWLFAAIPSVYKDAPAIGIIRGADAPTAQFIISYIMGSWLGTILLLGIAGVLTSLICLLLAKSVKKS